MRVRCTRIQLVGGPENGREIDRSPHITRGEEYLVLAVSYGSSNVMPLGLQIISDDGGPGWWPSSMFVTTTTVIPPNWTARVDEDGMLHLGPADWFVRGYWEDFFDAKPEAVAVYRREVRIIEASDPRPWDAERRKVVPGGVCERPLPRS